MRSLADPLINQSDGFASMYVKVPWEIDLLQICGMGRSRGDERIEEGWVSHCQRVPFPSWTNACHSPLNNHSDICNMSALRILWVVGNLQ